MPILALASLLVPLALGGPQQSGFQGSPLFSSFERDRILAYWREPDRYTCAVPEKADRQGLWQVRLTVSGSLWLLNYNRARGVKAPPTQIPGAQNEEQKAWEQWIDAKVAYDRYRAALVADAANERVLGRPVRPDDKTVPTDPQPWPGPAPASLVALAGNPPSFAETVVPMEHRVKFDDGTEIRYEDNVKMRARYAYYRFEKGAMSPGTPVKAVSPSTLDRLFKKAGTTESEARILRAVSLLEGGFDSVNTYDTGFVSVGFIQFASLKDGANSLGRMMLDYKQNDPSGFEADFRIYGLDVSPSGTLTALDLETGVEVAGADATMRIIQDKRCLAVFQRAGQRSDGFNAAQIRAAKRLFWPAEDSVTVNVGGRSLNGKVGDIVKSEAGLATLLDRKVNTGKLDPLATVVQAVADRRQVRFFLDLAKYEREIVDALRYRKDYLADTGLAQPK